MNARSSTAIYVRVPRSLLERFDEAARRSGLTRSEAVREAMRLYIKYVKASRLQQLRGLLAATRIPPRELDETVILG
ncbi:MAG: ribbon-helix-helix protein, CopG family [Crenarchaeota archaeon]|nr:ribbon-helix-helix protein, CopG family [Thermoproteota archaeon]